MSVFSENLRFISEDRKQQAEEVMDIPMGQIASELKLDSLLLNSAADKIEELEDKLASQEG